MEMAILLGPSQLKAHNSTFTFKTVLTLSLRTMVKAPLGALNLEKSLI